jgi:hypothetical protein
MGNCCSSSSSSSPDDTPSRPARPSKPDSKRFPGQGRTIGAAIAAKQGQPPQQHEPHPQSPQAPSGPAKRADDDEEAARRRELVLQSVENRNATGSGKLAQNLARQRAGGMDGARREAAAEAVRTREMDDQARARRGET